MAKRINVTEARRAYEDALREEIREEILNDEEGTLHQGCFSETDVEDARDEGYEEADKAWRYVEEYGGHTATCLSGALVGSQDLHPLCTCGWNHVATELERR